MAQIKNIFWVNWFCNCNESLIYHNVVCYFANAICLRKNFR